MIDNMISVSYVPFAHSILSTIDWLCLNKKFHLYPNHYAFISIHRQKIRKKSVELNFYFTDLDYRTDLVRFENILHTINHTTLVPCRIDINSHKANGQISSLNGMIADQFTWYNTSRLSCCASFCLIELMARFNRFQASCSYSSGRLGLSTV